MSKFVLVTGASSGIGAATVKRLDQHGFGVLAGVRKQVDAERITIDTAGRVIPLIMDVTKPETIEAALQQAQLIVGDQGLSGLVNNAGIVLAGPLETLPLEQIRHQFEVNVFGQLAVTQAFLSLLKKSTEARIVNVSSVSGLLALPTIGPYAGSKFALEAISDSLRMELRKSGIEVVLIQPGVVATPIWATSRAHSVDEHNQLKIHGNLPTAERQRYSRMMASVLGLQNLARPISPEKVAATIHTSLTARRPKPRYQVGWDARSASWFLRPLPTGLRDWIIRQVLRYSDRKSSRQNARQQDAPTTQWEH